MAELFGGRQLAISSFAGQSEAKHHSPVAIRMQSSSGRVGTVATLPSALTSERVNALGASWVFSFQSVLPSCGRPSFDLWDQSWTSPLAQSPEFGARQSRANLNAHFSPNSSITGLSATMVLNEPRLIIRAR